jgi:hypothetical protein
MTATTEWSVGDTVFITGVTTEPKRGENKGRKSIALKLSGFTRCKSRIAYAGIWGEKTRSFQKNANLFMTL